MTVTPTVTQEIERIISLFDGQFMRPDIRTQLVVSQIENDCGECRWAEQGEEYLDTTEGVLKC